jgi:UPF0716 protein FxsA
MLDDPRRANNLARDRSCPMSLLKWAIFGLLALPLAEVIVFVAVAVKLGLLAALALTILTSLAGMAVIRSAGRGEVDRLRTALDDRVITRVELDGRGFLTVVAGFLLLLPGFLTDIIGALLLLGPTRRLIHAALRRAIGRAAARAEAPRPGVVDLAPDQWRHVPDERIGPSGEPNS